MTWSGPAGTEPVADLKQRTQTTRYNARPQFDSAHKTLDAAVAAAYGWVDYRHKMSEEEILRRLLALNLAHPEFGGQESRSSV